MKNTASPEFGKGLCLSEEDQLGGGTPWDAGLRIDFEGGRGDTAAKLQGVFGEWGMGQRVGVVCRGCW